MKNAARLQRFLAGPLLVLFAIGAGSLGCATTTQEELPEVSAPVPIPPLSERSEDSLHNLFNASCDPTYLIYREGEGNHEVEARSEREWSEREAELRSCSEQVGATGFSAKRLERIGYEEGQIRAIRAAIEDGYYEDLVSARLKYEREQAGPIAAN